MLMGIDPRPVEHQDAAIPEGVEHLADLPFLDVAIGRQHDVESLCPKSAHAR